jgi:methylthioribose-1-phosphate isomerase
LLAKNFKIPFYVLAPPPAHARTGEDIVIEIRPDKELFIVAGQKMAPDKVKGYYPVLMLPRRNSLQNIFICTYDNGRKKT